MDLKHYAERYIRPSSNPNGKARKIGWRERIVTKSLFKNAKVLDIGAASGEFYETWKDQGIRYFGVDYNDTLVEYCQSKGLDVQKCDLSKDALPFEDGSFDLVYCSHVLEHLLSNEQIRFFEECSRVLKKGGTLVLFTPTPYSWYFWDDPTHQRASTHGSLEHLAKDFGLTVIETKYSNLRFFGQGLQKWLRLPPMRWFLWEVYLVAKK